MTAQWPEPAVTRDWLHANRSRTQTSSIANHTTDPASLLARRRRLPDVGKMRRSNGAIQNDPATRDRTDCVRGPSIAERVHAGLARSGAG